MNRLIFFVVLLVLCSHTLIAQQDFWEPTGGTPAPEGCFYSGGSARNSKGDIFFSSLTGNVYRSTDGGMTWSSSHVNAELHCLTVDSKDHVYVGAWSGQGVFRSTDNGETWTHTNFSYGYAVRIVADSGGGILVGTFHDRAGVIRSTDDGQTWAQIGPGNYEINGLVLNHAGHIFVSADNWLYRSTNNGTSWSNLGLNPCSGMYGIAFDSLGTIYAKAAWCWGLFFSTDQGASWDTVGSCPPHPDGASVGFTIAPNGTFYLAGSQAYAPQCPGSYRSTDHGLNWTRMTPISEFDCSEYLFEPNGHVLLSTGNHGLFHSTDSADTWQLVGPGVGRIHALAGSVSGEMVAGTNAGVYYHLQQGNFWLDGGLNQQAVRTVLCDRPEMILAGTADGIYSTSYFGAGWLPSGLQNTAISCLERSGSSDVLAGTTGGAGLYRSTDDGTSWSFVGLQSVAIRSVMTNGQESILVGTESAGVYRSTDAGVSWSFVGLPSITVSSLAAGFGGTVFAGSGSGVYKSHDNGTSWAYAGLAGRGIQDLLATSQNDLYAATSDSGVYRSTNGGQTWNLLVSGLNHLNVTCLALDQEGFLYAGTDGGGVYKSKEVLVAVREETAAVPSSFDLLQNYPNPFNPTTAIQYAIPVGTYGRTSLQVFDLLGRQVATLVNEPKEPGVYTVRWDASGVGSGMYFYRLKTGGFTATKRMILLK